MQQLIDKKLTQSQMKLIGKLKKSKFAESGIGSFVNVDGVKTSHKSTVLALVKDGILTQIDDETWKLSDLGIKVANHLFPNIQKI